MEPFSLCTLSFQPRWKRNKDKIRHGHELGSIKLNQEEGWQWCFSVSPPRTSMMEVESLSLREQTAFVANSSVLHGPRRSISQLASARTSPWRRVRTGRVGRGLREIAMMESWVHDLCVTGGITVLETLWILVWQHAASRKMVSTAVSRKVLHISCAPLFMVLWPMYSSAWTARWFCASIPAVMMFRLASSSFFDKQGSLAKVRDVFAD